MNFIKKFLEWQGITIIEKFMIICALLLIIAVTVKSFNKPEHGYGRDNIGKPGRGEMTEVYNRLENIEQRMGIR